MRRTNENIEEIKEAILPICIIEHTDNNIIFTISCPENLYENLKNNIISAFQSIKPISSKENYKNYSLAGYTINNVNNLIEINIFDKRCDYSNDNFNCETLRNLTTDSMGNLQKSMKISKFEMIKDDNNKYSNIFNCSFEEITTQKDDNNDEENFKNNLNIILELIKPLMKKEEFISLNELNNSTNNNSNIHFSKRKLEDKENLNIFDVKEESFFNQQLFGVNLGINLKNDFGLGNLENEKAISNLIRGEKINKLLNEQIFTNINQTLTEFIILSKAGNKLANSLYQHLNESFTSLKNIINSNITNLNNLLAFIDLSSIFDSTLAIDNLKELPNNIISTSLNSYHNINTLNNTIEDSISNIRDKLKNNIGDFLSDSHDLLNIIINNITILSNILSSNRSRIAEISTYYLNYTNTSYINIIQKAKLIIENYYINEKNLTDALLDDIFSEFSNNFMESMRIIQSLLDNVINNLKEGKLKIRNADNKGKQSVINNLLYTKIRINEILSNIKKILRNKTGIKENGYFEFQKKLDNIKKIYKDINDKAFNISYTLDNNLLIDTIFDNIMNDFKNEFINLLNNIEKSKREKFPLKNNMFLNSSFIINTFDKMDDDLKNEKIKILNYIKDENNYYIDSIEKETNTFIEEKKKYLDQLINNIDTNISELFLYNLDLKYSEMLDITFNSINNLIENNNRLAVEYLTQVKNAGSSHCSQLFINKANIFFNSLNEFKNYIQSYLNIDLINKYEGAINQTKNNLQIIKLNPIIGKYQKQLNFTANHLRIINILIPRINKYFSDELLNKKYLTKISKYINSTYNNLVQIETNLKTIYNSVSNLAYSSSTSYDYFLLRVYCYTYCSTKIFGICTNHKTECNNYYDGYTVSGTSNYAKIKKINFTEYSKIFDLLFYNVDSDVFNNILLYNNTLEIYDNNMILIKEEILNNTKNYLNNISEKINYFINEELIKNLTLLSYNYFKEEIRNKLTLEMSNIFFQWKEVLSQINTKIKSNIEKFKYSIQEYGIISELYNSLYSKNISYDYSNSIIDQRKNDFNYTLRYYYNMLLSKVNKTYSYILNNMPFNEEILNDIINIRNNEVQESYINKMNQIWLNKNNYLQEKIQLNIIGINESDFFDYKSYFEKNNGFFEKHLLNNYKELLKNIKNVTKESTDESVISRFYLENIQNERQIKEINEPVDKEAIIDLQNEEYKNLINDILKIEIDEFIKNIKNELIKSNNIIISNFEEEKRKYETILQNKIYKELYTKEELDNTIDIIYKNGLNISNINSTDEIYEHLNEILNKIIWHISNEVSKLTNELTSYSNSYEKIENTLNNYKTSIYNKIYSSILSINNDFYSRIVNKFYTNYLYFNIEIYNSNNCNIMSKS